MSNLLQYYRQNGPKDMFVYGLEKYFSHINKKILFNNMIYNKYLYENFKLTNEKKFKVETKVDRTPACFGFVDGVYSPGCRSVFELSDAIIAGERAVVLNNNFEIVLESVGGNEERFLKRSNFLLGNSYPEIIYQNTHFSTILEHIFSPIEIDYYSYDTVFPLVPIYHQGYYFWLLEYLPKLRAYEYFVEQKNKTPKILVQPDPPDYMIESLILAGVKPEHIIEWKGGLQKVNNVVLTDHRIRKFSGKGPNGFDYNPSPRDTRWVKNELLKNIDYNKDKKRYPNKIYISRQKASRGRRIENYKPLMEKLRERGFESFIFEDLSFEEQVLICNNADVIVGPHGAGLTNMIFADSASVVEIFNKEFLKPVYYLLAEECGHAYSWYIGNTIEKDIHVNVDEVCSIIDSQTHI